MAAFSSHQLGQRVQQLCTTQQLTKLEGVSPGQGIRSTTGCMHTATSRHVTINAA